MVTMPDKHPMNRRDVLRYGAAALCNMFAERTMHALPSPRNPHPVQVHISNQVLGTIPRDFIGLGYEISSIAQSGLLTSANRVYIQMVRNLGSAGVIRIGGNTSDYASYSPNGKAISMPKATVVNRASLDQLGSFLRATNWQLIWGLNLGSGTVANAVEEAQAVSATAKEKLLAFEIGNEVDLFSHEGHRHAGYTFADYLADYRRDKAAIRALLPNAPFAGPDAAFTNDWVAKFAAAEGHDLKLLTEHYYRAGQSPASSYQMLFNLDPNLTRRLQSLQSTAAGAHLPYRICETNSFSGGGRPGVSGTFGAALWVLDYMFTLASAEASGVNIETGVNQLGFISSYSPIGDNLHGTYTAKPEYYGMLAFAQAAHGQRLAIEAQTNNLNLTSYAVKSRHEIVATLINKDNSTASVEIRCDFRVSHASTQRLTAPALESTDRITLAGSTVTPSGHWTPSQPESLRSTQNTVSIQVPPYSAALVTLTT